MEMSVKLVKLPESPVFQEQIFVTTKLYPTEFDYPEGSIEDCLERLDIFDFPLTKRNGRNRRSGERRKA